LFKISERPSDQRDLHSFPTRRSSDLVEKVNPIEYYKTYELEKRAITLRDLLSIKNPYLTSQLSKDFFYKKAEETLVGFFEEFERSEEHTSELQSRENLVCRLLLEKKK